MIIQFLVSLAATLSFAVLFSAEKKQLFFCGLTGALGWIVYLICLQYHTDNACLLYTSPSPRDCS